MRVRGIRGAVRVAANERRDIFERTQELLRAMMEANGVRPADVGAAFFTMTPDLTADFPAYAARDMGWAHVPMICASEIAVPGAMDRVVRVLLLVNTKLAPGAIRHQYLGETQCLRPDLGTTQSEACPPKPSKKAQAHERRRRRGRRKRSSRSSRSTSRSDGGKR